jgi:parallel beta helix pectate lyase-like protein
MSRLSRSALIIVLFSLVLMPVSMGVDYYVDGVSGSDGNPGTEVAPFGTLGKAVSSIAAPGDRVLIYPGVLDASALISLATDGTIASPIEITAVTPTERPTISRTILDVTGDYVHITNIIFDGMGGQERAIDFWRPGVGQMVQGCDFMGQVELANNTIDPATWDGTDSGAIRVRGAMDLTVDDCDFFPFGTLIETASYTNYDYSPYSCIQIELASGNVVDATGFDQNIMSGFTVTDCNNFGCQRFFVSRRAIEDVTVTGCVSVSNVQFVYITQRNRPGSPLAQAGNGPVTSIRNVTIADCSASCGSNSGVQIDYATGGDNGPSANFVFQNLTLTHSEFSNQYGAMIYFAGTGSYTGQGYYENILIDNVTIMDPDGGVHIRAGIQLIRDGANAEAPFIKDCTISNCDITTQYACIWFGDGSGGENISIINNTMVSRVYRGIRAYLWDDNAGNAYVYKNLTCHNNDIDAMSVAIELQDGDTENNNGYENLTITDNNLLSRNDHCWWQSNAVVNGLVATGNVCNAHRVGFITWRSGNGDANSYSNWTFDNNELYGNGVRPTWGFFVESGVSGYCSIQNNIIVTGETGMRAISRTGNENVTISGNDITVGGNRNYENAFQAIQLYRSDCQNATITNNLFKCLNPRRQIGLRNAAIGREYTSGSPEVVNNLLQSGNTYIGPFSYLFWWDGGGSITNSTIENEVVINSKITDGAFRMQGVMQNVVIRNIDTDGSVMQADCIGLHGARGSNVLIENVAVNGLHQPSNDWAGLWAYTTGFSDLTLRNVQISNTGGPGMIFADNFTNLTIEDCVITNTGMSGIDYASTTYAAGWGIQTRGAAFTGASITNNLILNVSGGIQVEGTLNSISNNIIGLRPTGDLGGILVTPLGSTNSIYRNAVAGGGVTAGGTAIGAGIGIAGNSNLAWNNTVAGFATGATVAGNTNAIWNNAFAEITGTGITISGTGNTTRFNAIDAGTSYGGTAVASTGDVVAADLGIASYNPQGTNFCLPITSPPSVLLDAGSGDGGATADGTTDIGCREGGAASVATTLAGISHPFCFVDASAGNDANDGTTIALAVQSWAQALTNVPGGGVIYLVTGTIGGATEAGQIAIDNDASEAVPLVIQPVTGTSVIVRDRLDFGGSNVLLKDIDFDAMGQHEANIVLRATSTDTTVDGCSFTGAAKNVEDIITGMTRNVGIYNLSAPNTVVNNCVFDASEVHGITDSYAGILIDLANDEVALNGDFGFITGNNSAADGGFAGTSIPGVLSGLTVTNCQFITPPVLTFAPYGIVTRRGIHNLTIDNCSILDSRYSLLYMYAHTSRPGGNGPWNNVSITNSWAKSNGNSLLLDDGGFWTNVLIDNCTAAPFGSGYDTSQTSDYPVRFDGHSTDANGALGMVSDATISNCTLKGYDGAIRLLYVKLKNFTIDNCHLTSDGMTGSYSAVLLDRWNNNEAENSTNLDHFSFDAKFWENFSVTNNYIGTEGTGGRFCYYGNDSKAQYNSLWANNTFSTVGLIQSGNCWEWWDGAMLNTTIRDCTFLSSLDSTNARGLYIRTVNKHHLALGALIGNVTIENCYFSHNEVALCFQGLAINEMNVNNNTTVSVVNRLGPLWLN